MKLSVPDVIEALGGQEAAARVTFVSPVAVKKWRTKGISGRHWMWIVAATGLDYTDLEHLHPDIFVKEGK